MLKLILASLLVFAISPVLKAESDTDYDSSYDEVEAVEESEAEEVTYEDDEFVPLEKTAEELEAEKKEVAKKKSKKKKKVN